MQAIANLENYALPSFNILFERLDFSVISLSFLSFIWINNNLMTFNL